MIPTLTIGNAVIYQGNNLEILPELADNSVDSIVCDPPYELGFMGKSWDSSGIAYSVELWQECLRVLKPGGHLLAFGGTRTWHRLAVAIEDAGFEIRDNIAWLYGSGFPKSHNVGNAIDKKLGMGNRGHAISSASQIHPTTGEARPNGELLPKYEGRTPEGKQWDGWGTALKPAHEPIVVARKPLIGTVAENVLQHGVGGLNIDATRISGQPRTTHTDGNFTGGKAGYNGGWKDIETTIPEGRWPANIILDEYTAELLDEQSGITKSSPRTVAERRTNSTHEYGFKTDAYSPHNDSGGASRFFYVAKASKRDRNEGLQELETRHNGKMMRPGNNTQEKASEGFERFNTQPSQNFHPTVKPTALMQYLIRLVTPDNGVVLDPFCGSGSTGKAAILENKSFIGIELTPEYLPIIEGRLKHAYLTLDDKEEDLFG
jgi:DNA modification methylase